MIVSPTGEVLVIQRLEIVFVMMDPMENTVQVFLTMLRYSEKTAICCGKLQAIHNLMWPSQNI